MASALAWIGLIALNLALSWATYRWGKTVGAEGERLRAIRLLQNALDRRWSGTVRWVLNAVYDRREQLLPHDEWFTQPPDGNPYRSRPGELSSDYLPREDTIVTRKEALRKEALLYHREQMAKARTASEILRDVRGGGRVVEIPAPGPPREVSE